jgi:hypothetical protein
MSGWFENVEQLGLSELLSLTQNLRGNLLAINGERYKTALPFSRATPFPPKATSSILSSTVRISCPEDQETPALFTTKDTKATKMEFDELSRVVIWIPDPLKLRALRALRGENSANQAESGP